MPIEPELDLHAFAPRDIASVVEEYVDGRRRRRLREVRLVHGRGRGVQRGIVQAALERHPLRRGVLGRYRRAPRRDDRATAAAPSVERRRDVDRHAPVMAGGDPSPRLRGAASPLERR